MTSTKVWCQDIVL